MRTVCLFVLLCVSALSYGAKKYKLVEISTNLGNIKIRLYENTPRHSENFLKLVKAHHYDSLLFHRVIGDFMIQGGDPTGTGCGGESVFGKNFEDEFSLDARNYYGALSMANAGPNTNGSQFFITTVPTPWLHMHHTIFGEVIEGMDVVRKIENTPTGFMDKPVKPQKIESATVE